MKIILKLTSITKCLICVFLFSIAVMPNNGLAVTNTKKISAINGRVTAPFKYALTTTPKVTDFGVTQVINGKATKVTINSTKRTATLTVPVITKTSVAQNVVYKVSYKKDIIVSSPTIIVSKVILIVKPVINNTVITSKFSDVNFKTEVYSLIRKASPAPILYSDVKNIKDLGLSNKKISNLSGIEYFTSLTVLYCDSNKLTTLDVSKNTNLTQLYCNSNQLTILDISKSTALRFLDCSKNQLSTLYFNKNKEDDSFMWRYKIQYIDSTHKTTTDKLVITIKALLLLLSLFI
ncbi:hypothetical protein K9O30_02675 [Clostridium bowmanii]|uniref:leucine-rich repeat domain-containing protein n=1 Tax=Clostridium bowmanii TaxID=132925 RepID=UPI001C0DF1BF|nr:hypothetical protein [Clostridium bowmanii]MBU3188276.1 hypothetical protein [Clostridium bowmanii]MCA1072663.1 hypothetical protein [Clostridium bowmanii]